MLLKKLMVNVSFIEKTFIVGTHWNFLYKALYCKLFILA